MTELPSGTVTFLFTDIEGSTALWEHHPDAMPVALARHDEILRTAITGHRGTVYAELGDGMAAVFASARDAVAAGVDAQQRWVEEPWSDLPGPIRVRVGVHTGEGVLINGQYLNQPLNRCSRLMAVAHGGQILISSTTEPLVHGALPPEVTLSDLGEHRLRDLAEPVRVFQVCHFDLATTFPPLRSLDRLPGNLSPQLTSFVGRDEELVSLAAALRSSRLVTLTGPGGVGKTRLAWQVAADTLPTFPGGAWSCELATVDDADGMLEVVAAALGVAERMGATLEQSIVEYLRGRHLLLVLDNCEHLLDDVARLTAAILRSCPEVRIVATSREFLDLPGEQVVRVRSLSVPGVESTVDELVMNPSVQLVRDRIAAAGVDIAADSEDLRAVGEICRRLDGIPLALELAAARATSMAPAEIAAHLDERFRLLTGRRRGGLERHQTLRATVDWSYSLLGPRERIVFDRLGVFSGAFHAAAAENVVSGDGLEAWDVLDALDELVVKSMVVVERVGGTTRYQLLETLRHYAREQLSASGELDSLRCRHAAYYGALAQQIGEGVLGPDESVWLQRFQLEIENLRAAVTWALDAPEDSNAELGLRIIAWLAFESTGGALNPGAWATQAISRTDAAEPAIRTAVLGLAAWRAFQRGNLSDTLTLAEAALRDGLPADTPYPEIPFLALALATPGEAALKIFDRGDAELRAADAHPSHLSRLHASGSAAAMIVGDVERAKLAAEDAVHNADAAANPGMREMALFAVANAWWPDAPVRALAAVHESIDLARRSNLYGHPTFLYALSLAARLHAEVGDVVEARDSLREAVAISDDVGDRPALMMAVERALAVLAMAGQDEAGAVVGGFVGTPVNRMRSILPRRERSERRGTLEALRDRLGNARYDELVAKGAAMSDDETIAFVREALAPDEPTIDAPSDG
jgi:predicted ATPase/class 3 adenylate cyclase